MLSLVASASSLVLEVLGACSMTDSLRSPVAQTIQLVTGVKLPIEQFDMICRLLVLGPRSFQFVFLFKEFEAIPASYTTLSPSFGSLSSCTDALLPLLSLFRCRSNLGSGFSTLIAGTIISVVGQVLLITSLSSPSRKMAKSRHVDSLMT